MKIITFLSFKDYFWKTIKQTTNSFSHLRVISLGNGYIKCLWDISAIDNLRIKFSKSYFYAIRLFDISNNRNINNSTCIMKEIQVSKFQSSIKFPIPIDKGVYYFEFGYRKRNGEWRKLAYQNLNLGYRIKKTIQNVDQANWFSISNQLSPRNNASHEKDSQLSSNRYLGGSENILYDQ